MSPSLRHTGLILLLVSLLVQSWPQRGFAQNDQPALKESQRMTPEQKQQMRERFKALPPERQEELRKKF